MIGKIDHIGIAVKDLEEALNFYENYLNISAAGTEEVEEQKVRVAFLPVGESKLELLEGTTEDSPVNKFIDKKGPGVQHIALRVEDINNSLEDLKAQGVRLIDEQPRYGAGGAKIAFVHPKSTGGTLIELCERYD